MHEDINYASYYIISFFDNIQGWLLDQIELLVWSVYNVFHRQIAENGAKTKITNGKDFLTSRTDFLISSHIIRDLTKRNQESSFSEVQHHQFSRHDTRKGLQANGFRKNQWAVLKKNRWHKRMTIAAALLEHRLACQSWVGFRSLRQLGFWKSVPKKDSTERESCCYFG